MEKNSREALEQMRAFGLREQMETEDIDGHCLTIATGKGNVEIGIWNHLDVVPEGKGMDISALYVYRKGWLFNWAWSTG